jgi:hypothetical protein
MGQKNKTQLYDVSLFFNDYKKNEVSFSATLRNIGSPWLKKINVTDVSMCSGETNFIFYYVSLTVHLSITLANDQQRLQWSRGSVLAFSTQVRGFLGRKNPQHVFLRR